MAGVAEYFALKKAANPEDRNIKGISTMMALNAQKPDPYGIQGLANLPLSYALGKATANAGEFDQNTANQAESFMQQQLQQHKDDQLQKLKESSMKNWLELGKTDPLAANDYAAKDPILQSALPSGIRLKDKISKDGWLTGEALSEDGTTKTTYEFNLGGMDAAKQKLQSMGITGTPTADQLAEAMPQGYVFKLSGAATPAKDAGPPKTREVQRGSLAITEEYDDQTGSWNEIGRGPKWNPRSGGQGDNSRQDRREAFEMFKRQEGDVRRLGQIAEQGYKGQFSMPDGTIVSFDGSEQARVALDKLMRERRAEVAAVHPGLTAKYHPDWIHYPNKTSKQLDPATAKQILYDAGGDKEKARQMARGLGFTF